jgi:predicted AAA+ superfamily ATPase
MHNFVSMLDGFKQSYCFSYKHLSSLPDKMQVQTKKLYKLYVYQYLLFAAIWNWLLMSSHDVVFAIVESATARHLCVWNFGMYTSIYTVTLVLINWLEN